MPNAECLFCGFDKKYIVAENDYAFATYFPRAIKPGHLVVATKAHKPTFTDISDAEARGVMSLGLSVATVAQKMIGAQKYYVVAIGDMDHRFHIHLLPKMANDAPMGKYIMLDGGWKGEVGKTVSREQVIDFIEQVRRRLQNEHE